MNGSPERLLEQLESYLDCNMPETERKEFEDRLREDEKLRRDLNAFRLMRQAGQVLVAKDLKGMFRQWDRKARMKKRGTRRLLPYLSIAAGLLLLFVALLVMSRPYSPDRIFTSFYQAPNSGMERSGESAMDPGISAALEAYYQREYETALEAFGNVRPAQDGYGLALAYIADIHIQEQRWPEAKEALRTLIRTGDGNRARKAEWKLLLLKGKLQEVDEEMEGLTSLLGENPEHPYHARYEEWAKMNEHLLHRIFY